MREVILPEAYPFVAQTIMAGYSRSSISCVCMRHLVRVTVRMDAANSLIYIQGSDASARYAEDYILPQSTSSPLL